MMVHLRKKASEQRYCTFQQCLHNLSLSPHGSLWVTGLNQQAVIISSIYNLAMETVS